MGRSRKNYSKLQKELAHEWKKNSASIEEDIHNEIEKETEPYQEIEIGSNIISNFLKYLNDVEKDYIYSKEQVELEQSVTQDLLHAIEFSENYEERCRLATQLKKCRQRRRHFKDRVEELEPLYLILQKDDIHKTQNTFSSICGSIRKTEKYHNEREYKPKVLKMEVIKNAKVR